MSSPLELQCYVYKYIYCQHQGLNMPSINYLPDELLARIMIYCLTARQGHYKVTRSLQRSNNISWQGSSIPLILGAVSGLWRDIAFTLPQLWSTVRVELGADTEACSTTLDALAVSLERAKSRPVSLTMTSVLGSDGEPEEPDESVQTRLAHILRGSKSNWHSIELLSIELQWGLILANGIGTFASLTNFRSSDPPGCPRNLEHALRSLPSLRTLAVHALCPSHRPKPGAYLGRLVVLNLKLSVSASRMAGTLSPCHSLEECTLDFDLFPGAMPAVVHADEASPQVLPHLAYLSITSTSDITPIFKWITARALKTLILRGWHEPAVEHNVLFSASVFSRFCERSACMLDSVHFDIATPDSPSDLETLKAAHLDLSTCETIEFALMLVARCQGLDSCNLACYSSMDARDLAPTPTLLKDLTALRISDVPTEDWDFLFGSLVVPKLKELHLTVSAGIFYNNEGISPGIVNFVTQTKCTLEIHCSSDVRSIVLC